jgi:predicted ATPase
LTILSGTNSSGKSSFIQLLLLLKQTLEVDSAQRPLDLDGNLFKVHKYSNILKKQNEANKLKIEFLFNKSELQSYKDYHEIRFYDAAYDNYDLKITSEFDIKHDKVFVNYFEVKFIANGAEKFIQFKNNESSFEINTDLAVFSEKLYFGGYEIRKINFLSFIPSDCEIESEDGNITKEVPNLDGVKAILKDFFAGINYIGPLRRGPLDSYSISNSKKSVGVEGENVADTLYELSKSSIPYFKVEEKDEVVDYVQTQGLFLDAVKYWLCDRFKLCSDIYSDKEAESYIIKVKNLEGIESTIKHVGFGISQVLPIIVEGLRISAKDTLIIEQPEIHLHPKIQSALSDFFISLIKQEKKVIIETHSDHLITRLRRRIAEDVENKLEKTILLTFVEVGSNDVLFRNIGIDDLGNLDFFPEDFIERPDAELKAILKAQMKKRFKQN